MIADGNAMTRRTLRRGARYFFLASILLRSGLSARAQERFDPPFFFGIANAAAQSEDGLDDIWKDWADGGHVAAYRNQAVPEKRLEFWSKPGVELDWAAKTGVQVYRLGVDWGRVEPVPHRFDAAAIARYRAILRMVRARHMKVMLTLMHHSLPKWEQARGGWLSAGAVDDYLEFSRRMIDEYHGDVAYWITFNEADVFAPLAYSYGQWPPGGRRPWYSLAALGPLRGETVRAMDRMAQAHVALYDWAHAKYPDIQMGVAHNMAHYAGKTALGRLEARYPDALLNWRFPERLRGRMDFFGMNYYGAEWIKDGRLDIDPSEEYSEAGRAIDPAGLLTTLTETARRFPRLPIVVTENGIADSTDVLRPAYLIEHLTAVARARARGVPVVGYIVWTLSDNLEWADGYCPKFGLLSVDRAHGLRRVPRASYFVFKKIVESREITADMRREAWAAVAANAGKPRPFCRAADAVTGLDAPVARPFSSKDWRLTP
ncbi:MAG: glycoside hydrolase family 1 protein [Elusimicrobia bacterium]|nr:glycoside hydrolase family 1 protein [Elusimicrobiota bacterium]